MRVRVPPAALTYHVRYQKTSYSCGATAVMNALRSLGKRVSERRISSLAGTEPEKGTTEDGVLVSIRELGFVAMRYETDDKVAAWAWMSESLKSSRPIILCISNWQHWVTAIGMLGDRVIIVDPTNAMTNKRENGVVVLSKRELIRKWMHSQKGGFFGISIGRR